MLLAERLVCVMCCLWREVLAKRSRAAVFLEQCCEGRERCDFADLLGGAEDVAGLAVDFAAGDLGAECGGDDCC